MPYLGGIRSGDDSLYVYIYIYIYVYIYIYKCSNATQGNAMQSKAKQCNTMQYNAMQRKMQCNAMQPNAKCKKQCKKLSIIMITTKATCIDSCFTRSDYMIYFPHFVVFPRFYSILSATRSQKKWRAGVKIKSIFGRAKMGRGKQKNNSETKMFLN